MNFRRTGAVRRPWMPMLILAFLLALIPLLGGGAAVEAQGPSPVVINEFMASNSLTLADEDGDFSDWIELYNRDSQPISLAGVGLSDNSGAPFRWVFPAIELAPGEHLLIWASGKNRATPGSPLHTNFSISAGGEPLLLTHPTAGQWDVTAAVALPADISFGRQPDGAGGWFYFDRPTPAGSNNGSPAYTEILAPPVFFAPRRFLHRLLRSDAVQRHSGRADHLHAGRLAA